MKIAKLELFKAPPRWLFLKMTTDDGLVGWGAGMESGVSLLQVGAAQPGKGKRSEIAPGGYFGGLIDDVTFYLGAAAVQADVETLRAGPAR